MLVQFDKINIKNTSLNNIESFVFSEIQQQFPKKTFIQREYLYFLFTNKESNKVRDAKESLLNKPTVHFCLNAKVEDSENPFDEKQDDTADILVVKDGFYEVIDIKTRNLSKTAQAPNIISSFKLAQLCAIMVDNKEFDDLSINYFEVDWILEKEKLVCKDAHFVSLFKSVPENLYINWAAAMQIQFHVCNLDQEFNGTIEEWCKSYLKHFVAQVYRRSNYMIAKYAKPFEKYID